MFVGGGESWGWGNAEKSSFYLASIRANICFSSESNLTSIGDDNGDVDAIEQVDHISKLLFFTKKAQQPFLSELEQGYCFNEKIISQFLIAS